MFTDTHLVTKPKTRCDILPAAISNHTPDPEALAAQLEPNGRIEELKTLVETVSYNGPNSRSSMAPMLGQAEQVIVINGTTPSTQSAKGDPCVEATLYSRVSINTTASARPLEGLAMT